MRKVQNPSFFIPFFPVTPPNNGGGVNFRVWHHCLLLLSTTFHFPNIKPFFLDILVTQRLSSPPCESLDHCWGNGGVSRLKFGGR